MHLQMNQKSYTKYLTFLTLNNTGYGSNISILIKLKLVTTNIIMQKNPHKILALLTVYNTLQTQLPNTVMSKPWRSNVWDLECRYCISQGELYRTRVGDALIMSHAVITKVHFVTTLYFTHVYSLKAVSHNEQM
jgi:hypothetical protein